MAGDEEQIKSACEVSARTMGASFTHILKIYGRTEAGTTHKHPKKQNIIT